MLELFGILCIAGHLFLRNKNQTKETVIIKTQNFFKGRLLNLLNIQHLTRYKTIKKDPPTACIYEYAIEFFSEQF